MYDEKIYVCVFTCCIIPQNKRKLRKKFRKFFISKLFILAYLKILQIEVFMSDAIYSDHRSQASHHSEKLLFEFFTKFNLKTTHIYTP